MKPHFYLTHYKKVAFAFKYIFSIGLFLFAIMACTKTAVDPDNPDPANGSDLVYCNLVASENQIYKITLKWDALKGSQNYKIFRSDQLTGSPFEPIGETKMTVFDDTTVTTGEPYFYKIQIQFSPGKSVMSDDIAVGRAPEPTEYDLASLAYTKMADQTGGKRYDVGGASMLPDTIIKIIKQNVGNSPADIIFHIDNTGTMWDDIDAVKKGLNKIIDVLPASTRLGAAGFRDHDDLYFWRFQDLTTDFSTVRTFINKMTANGGGDLEEDIYDSLFETATHATWQNRKRIVILIGDSAPHEGDKTQHSAAEVIAKYKQAGINVNIYPILITEPEPDHGGNG